ncbi:zinc carboxypeptidase-like [Achroia grisella]|uniref:zinc carboxypeptidase-like n=1 Tax=Achroia grisella TaxID=688607 RepID=UPI0027D29F15|nr:zinc carboxypeptidase-like [Achroia grisella]
MLLKLLILSAVLLVGAEKVDYSNYGMYNIVPQNTNDVEYLRELYKKPDGLRFWSEPSQVGGEVVVIVPPDVRSNFEDSLSRKGIVFEMTSNNVQEIINAEVPKRKRRNINDGEIYFDACLTVNQINQYFSYLSRNNSAVANMFTIGKSFEGRDINGIRISRGSPTRTFVLTGGEIGADCLSPTILTYIVKELFEAEDPEARAATEQFEWHIIPVINPDGFDYSQTVDRLWLKNRRRDNMVPDGVDLTKNWNSNWGSYGGSFDATHENYIGIGPFSEIETRLVSNYILNLAQNMSGLLSFRTFGQRLLLPFGDNYNQMIVIGRRSLGSLSVRYNTQYLAGLSTDFANSFTGNIGGWVKDNFKAPIVATYALRNTHVLQANLITPACEETYDSVMAILREARFINVI